jgi:hypothetical protein
MVQSIWVRFTKVIFTSFDSFSIRLTRIYDGSKPSNYNNGLPYIYNFGLIYLGIIVGDPDLVKQIMVKDYHIFINRRPVKITHPTCWINWNE